MNERDLRELVATGLQARATTIERIVSCSQRLGRHPGAGRLREVVQQLAGTSSASSFERDARQWLCDQGLPPHPGLYPIRAEDDVVVELDIAYPDEMVYVDCQGFPWHSLPSSLAKDTIRENGVVAVGWVSLRLDEQQFATRSPAFVRQLRTLLRDRAEQATGARAQHRSPARRARAW